MVGWEIPMFRMVVVYHRKMVVKNGGLMAFNQQTSVILMGCTLW
jgi:hypothetical protein